MQNRGSIMLFTLLFAVVCLYQLSFTWIVNGVEDDAYEYAINKVENNQLIKKDSLFNQEDFIDKQYKLYLDSVSSEDVYNIWIAKYTYNDCKQRQINLGLDLKGGMNVTLEVMVVDVLKALSNNSTDSLFNLALNNSISAQKNSQKDFMTLFSEEYAKVEVAENKGLSLIFSTSDLREKIKLTSTNKEVIDVLNLEVEDAIDRSFNILRSRIDKFGVTQPNIQKLETAGRILVELPGIKNPERARKLLQSTAKLEFWETYEARELFSDVQKVNEYLRETNEANNEEDLITGTSDKKDDVSDDFEDDLFDFEGDTLESDTTQSADQFFDENPFFALMFPNVDQQTGNVREGPALGSCNVKDTAELNSLLNDEKIKSFFPSDVKFAYEVKPYDDEGRFVQLIALRSISKSSSEAAMEGEVVTDASQTFAEFGNNADVSMSMNKEGARKWKKLTGDNIGKSVAIVLDNYVYSFPTVQAQISGGRSSITGNFTVNEAKDLANILKSGKLPAPARIIEEAIVGPSLGEEAINAGLKSFIFALVIVLIYMIFYYNRAGLVSNVALLANIFFIFGVLSSLGAVLTLPGIAGIVLTIGMSVDANVLIYERIREELKNGKGLRLAIKDGYNSAYSSIIDANVTTLLTGIVLYTFGTGPIKGFATTLVIGILTSLFAAIFITRLVISSRLNKGKEVTFSTKLTDGAFKNINIDFIGKRKKFYILSSVIVLLGIGSLFTKGLNYGVDFVGGRTYVVRFAENIDKDLLRQSLSNSFVDSEGLKYTPQIKTFGDDNQIKITTSFMINDNSLGTDEIVESKLSLGLDEINSNYEIMSSQKVGPTIADDIKDSAVGAIFFSLLIIFFYILVRFRRWQFSLGAVAAVFHDVVIVLSIFSILYGIMPFSLEIDQAFIAAILTIIGYSLNDTVVVFDRVREYINNNKKKEVHEVINGALNSTLSRTINTSLTTFFVLLLIFIFGGEVIRGFMFALMIGVLIGTYSSLFVASPIMLDTIVKKSLKKK
ncbi:MAG: protein translocase subunit SecDF [Flavobacteriales bacterium]|nr:protein translocase subunit SecDF [Flavobacteriales bacterium]|tara:strand:- start:3027 stop:6050 length:3024 start_codon:yes stop_codon:yes gene_type:complete